MSSEDYIPITPSATSQHNSAGQRLARFGKRSAVVLALAGATIGGGVAGSAITVAALMPASVSAAGNQVANQATTTASAVYQQNKNAIVEIEVTGSTNRFGMTESGSGSGVIVDSKGYILTNNHVVAGASDITVKFSNGQEVTGQVLGTDSNHDLALIKVALPSSATVATLGNSDQVQVGETAIAIGSPFGLDETVTQGIISAVNRTWQADDGSVEHDMLQTDAPINPGNSGGALLNATGEVIGITTSIESPVRGSVGVGFAVPINTAKQVIEQLATGAQIEPAWLGVSTQQLTPAIAQMQGINATSGVLVTRVMSGSPAAVAGLQPGDVISAIDETNVAAFTDMSAVLSNHTAGDTVKLSIERNGQPQTLSVKLGSQPQQ